MSSTKEPTTGRVGRPPKQQPANSKTASSTSLSNDAEKVISALSVKFEEEMKLLKEEMLGLIREKDGIINSLKLEVNTLKVKVSKMEEKIDDTEAYERRDTLVISGAGVPQATNGENSTEIVKTLIHNKLHLNIQPGEISTAHRIGKPPINQVADRRNIIVKLCRRDLKGDILNACRQLKPDIYINESLTPIRNTIYYVIRKMRKLSPNIITGCRLAVLVKVESTHL